MFNKKLILLLSIISFSLGSYLIHTDLTIAQSIKIDVGEAKSKKSIIAMPAFFGGLKSGSLEKGIIKNLQFSTYFDFIKKMALQR